MPRSLGDLGVSASERERHIAWDIGALGVARELAALLDAELVAQRYSRLVIDCNRPPDSPELCTERSEATDIPGNRSLTQVARDERRKQIYQPYHDCLRELLDRREAAGRTTVIIAVHSFTPVYLGRARPWQLGLLSAAHERRLAEPMLEFLRTHGDFCIGDNEPYRIDEKDHGIPTHALGRGLLNVLIEIRQDLITHSAGQRAWAQRLAATLRHARTALNI
jgi:predicted N-formylglutamate amidohydrolase